MVSLNNLRVNEASISNIRLSLFNKYPTDVLWVGEGEVLDGASFRQI